MARRGRGLWVADVPESGSAGIQRVHLGSSSGSSVEISRVFDSVITVGVSGIVAQVVIDMAGSVFKRCGCRDPVSGRMLGAGCPDLSEAGHGSWFFSLELPPGAEGKRRRLRRGGYATERAAIEALERVGGVRAGSEALTVGVWLRRWLMSRLSLRAETVRSYAGHIEGYLVPHLGGVLLADLTRSRVQAMFTQVAVAEGMAGKAISTATLHRIHATLRAALNEAMRVGLIGSNPAVGVELPSSPSPRPTLWTAERVAAWQAGGKRPAVPVWTPAQTAAFLALVRGHRLYALFHLVALTGLRRGEVCGLTWADLDLDAGVLSVTRQRRQTTGRIAVAPPKSLAGIREIALDHTTVTALRQHRHRQPAEHAARSAPGERWYDSGYVFTYPDGRPLSPDRLSRIFAVLVGACGLPPVTLHGLRHGAATMALAAGADLKTVQAMLGHSSIQVTADIYPAILPQAAHDDAEHTASLLFAPRRRHRRPAGGRHGVVSSSPASAVRSSANPR